MSEGKVPEEGWIDGLSLGWRGPCGTTFPPNIRLTLISLHCLIIIEFEQYFF